MTNPTEAQAPAAPDFEQIVYDLFAALETPVCEHEPGDCELCADDMAAIKAALTAALASSSAERIALEKRVGELEREAAKQAMLAEGWRLAQEQAERDRDQYLSDLHAMTRHANALSDKRVEAESALATAHQRAAEAMREAWQPIETMPDEIKKNGTPIWLAKVSVQIIGEWWSGDLNDGAGWVDDGGSFLDFSPTHWQPLPIPPAGEKE